MNYNYYSYKRKTFICKYCGWTGLGREVLTGETFDYGFDIDCPKCYEKFQTFIPFPTFDEVIKNGSKEDKLHAFANNTVKEKWLYSSLKSTDQLPELLFESMAFVLKEVEEDDQGYIVISYKNKVIWKEIRLYEYYKRFIELGKLFKEKYGDKMIDLIPDENVLHLYGDKVYAFELIENFRKDLHKKDKDT